MRPPSLPRHCFSGPCVPYGTATQLSGRMGLRSSESKSRGVSSATSDGEIDHITGLWYPSLVSRASLIAQVVKNLPAKQEAPVQFLGWEGPRRRDRLPTPEFWPRESHGLYSPWGRKESDTTGPHFHTVRKDHLTWTLSKKQMFIILRGGHVSPWRSLSYAHTKYFSHHHGALP